MILSSTSEVQERPLFQVIFLKNDFDESVWIEEVDKINLSEIKEHLALGESIFITGNQNNKLITCKTSYKQVDEKQLHPNRRIRKNKLERKSIRLVS